MESLNRIWSSLVVSLFCLWLRVQRLLPAAKKKKMNGKVQICAELIQHTREHDPNRACEQAVGCRLIVAASC